MVDVHSLKIRSFNMSRILSKNTKPEISVRKFLYKHGIRYRLHDARLPGKPDIVIRKYKIVIFVHGCFWHSHKNCKYASNPKSNKAFWNAKLQGNVARDKKNKAQLKKIGYKVLIFWECKLKKNNLLYLERLLANIEKLGYSN
ncbi:MAG TPA: DNA mismatch endonuclease Vsr [Ignavibacteria bacterium]|nr:very short patch repair endonuclease [Bacteroidota bacterium]HRE09994.1 DNA mismatch endonuclease Vsr [Ignavibacteria bacterium]HRF66939.1 DNA mismatch endonuclease Vsr [Ignavibacteria bacterium]HRJ85493.1 DNA mismatch endonuclease Vsr [Ignavibacteria bacterium]